MTNTAIKYDGDRSALDASKEAIVRRYRGGDSIGSIAADMGVPHGKLYRKLIAWRAHRSRRRLGGPYVRRTWSVELVAQITERRRGGETISKIAADVGIPFATLARKFQELGVVPETPPLRGRVPAERTEAVLRLYGEGRSQRMVAAEMGLSRQQVKWVLFKAGVHRSRADAFRLARSKPWERGNA